MIRRINLFGGPGCGKSRTAAAIYAQLKAADIQVELVREFVKDWAWEGRMPTDWDQIYIFGEQLRREEIVLRNSPTTLIVTDCPLLLGLAYTHPTHRGPLFDLILEFDAQYPVLNIFIERGDKPYHQVGRFQTLSEAIAKDQEIINLLWSLIGKDWHTRSYTDISGIMSLILEVQC